MPATRSSARLKARDSSPNYSEVSSSAKSAAGRKRKTETGSSPTAKRGKKADEKEQKTLEETFEDSKSAGTDVDASQDKELEEVIEKSKSDTHGLGESDVPKPQEKKDEALKDTEMQETPALVPEAKIDQVEEVEEEAAKEGPPKHETATGGSAKHDQAKGAVPEESSYLNNGVSEEKSGDIETAKTNGTDIMEPKQSDKMSSELHTNGETAVEANTRESETPSSILEKGILYFFFRGRVNIDDPHNVNDIARTYILMRPIPHGASLSNGPIGDSGNCRLLALPKKVLPLSGKDRYMVFVEKAKTTLEDLKRNVMGSSEYQTQTAGTRHTPAMTPVGEAVYAITTTGRESHLAYILTTPEQIGEVQNDVGLRERGSFVVSAKNPQYSGPANASLPKGPEYPQEILDEFRSLRWMPLKPKLLDYVNTQFLVIGNSHGLDSATQQQPQDEKQENATPAEELEKLEGEDEIRVKHLKGDDAIFADLDLSKKEYPPVPNTW